MMDILFFLYPFEYIALFESATLGIHNQNRSTTNGTPRPSSMRVCNACQKATLLYNQFKNYLVTRLVN